MQKPSLRLSAFSAPPFFMLEDQDNKTILTGPFDVIFNLLVKHLNTSYEIVDGGNEMGREINPGNWTGAIGLILSKDADVMVTPCTTEAKLEPYLLFSTSFDQSSFGILSGPPMKVVEKENFIFASIGFETQTCFFISWILVSLLYYLMKNEARITERQHKDIRYEDQTFFDVLLRLYGLLFKIGMPKLSRNAARRIILTGWLFCTFALTTMLSTVLYSKLAVTGVPERINNVRDLIKHPKLKPVVLKGVILDTFLETSTKPELVSLWQQVLKSDGLIDIYDFFDPELMNEIYEGRTVAVTSVEYIVSAMISLECQRQKRPFYTAKESIMKTYSGMCFRNGLEPEYVEAINRAVVIIGGMGFMPYIRDTMSRHSYHCVDRDSSSRTRTIHTSLGLRELKQSFIFLTLGWAAGLIAFVTEFFVRTGIWF